MGSRMGWMIGMVMVMVGLVVQNAEAAVKYRVGDGMGWTVPPTISYHQNWANNNTFQPGDSLVFNWTGTHNVLKVTSEDEYNNCTKTNGVLQSFSPYTYDMPQNDTLYFICTVGSHCSRGQKVKIKVGNGVPPPSDQSASPPCTINIPLFVLLFAAILCLFAS